MKKRVRAQDLIRFQGALRTDERSANTVSKYLRDAAKFQKFLEQDYFSCLSKQAVIAYKERLTRQYKPSSVNSMLAAINGFLVFLGRPDCKVKLLKIQRTNFRLSERELSRSEYRRLLDAAKQRGDERMYLLMQAICCTGIRVSELRYITVETLKYGMTRVNNKGRERAVLLPRELRKALLQYCARHDIRRGPVFVTRNGLPMNRSNIWAAMKRLCRMAGVDSQKVFPHNLRHLFALTYYVQEKDIAHLADILGHASIETTRIYTSVSGDRYQRSLSRMQLFDTI
ncbi:tyrosine-type recombinase/integrase [Pseudoflavonifractor phocaeensis]|uniref:tyrosine-type recombinase/integrase n=1 Tax=Pseudoflavonifractor phocaeensis TaxID=1870988 RepID=UPI0021096FD9|nr:tyrosine-type recombinase/integrase [Pseudoflavonifractor phocaeensis]MCQ4863516.1 tyrosine-type recombinase/integrase [Pseudoflavonifractor phocaeensis]